MICKELNKCDPEVFEAIEKEAQRQKNGIELNCFRKLCVRSCHGCHGQCYDQ